MSKTQNVTAILEATGARLKTTIREIPTPGPHDLVVRNHAIAVNPVDWKIQDFGWFAIKNYPTVLGSDVCGVVTSVGSDVTKFKVGDRVTGFSSVIYTGDIDGGAWQTYTILRDIATTKIPGSMSFEEGSVFPMALATAAIAFFVILGLPRPTGDIVNQKSSILVWGASSSVGTMAVQLAKNMGLKVFATASQKHHEYIKSLGASEVFDYHDADVVEKIVAAAKSAGTWIELGFDTITEGTTTNQAVDVLVGSGGKGKLAIVLQWADQASKPDSIEVVQTAAFRTGTDQAELGKWLFNEYLEKALEDGSIVPAPPVDIVPGGIAAAQKAFDMSKAGVSGKKLVVRVE